MSEYLLARFQPITTIEDFDNGLAMYLQFIEQNKDGNKRLGETLEVISSSFTIYKFDVAFTTAANLSNNEVARFFYQVMRFGFYDISKYPTHILNEIVPLHTKYNQILACGDVYVLDPNGYAGIENVNTPSKHILRLHRADRENLTLSFSFDNIVHLSEKLLDIIVDEMYESTKTLTMDEHSGFLLSLQRINELVGVENDDTTEIN